MYFIDTKNVCIILNIKTDTSFFLLIDRIEYHEEKEIWLH